MPTLRHSNPHEVILTLPYDEAQSLRGVLTQWLERHGEPKRGHRAEKIKTNMLKDIETILDMLDAQVKDNPKGAKAQE